MSPSNKSSPFDGTSPQDGQLSPQLGSPSMPSVMIRKLPRNTTKDTLNSMLIFAKDLVSVDFVDSIDAGFMTAIAKFHSEVGAREARTLLNGKQNFTKDASMIVEIVPIPANKVSQTGTSKSPDTKHLAPASQGVWPSSRFNETFQALDRGASPPSSSHGDSVKIDGNSHQGFFLPPSPMPQALGRQGNTGKNVIGQDIVDDETGKLLDDPMGFMNSDLGSGIGTGMGGPPGRRSTLPHIPVTRLANLSFTNSGNGSSASGSGNGMISPPMSGMLSPRIGTMQSPNTFGHGTSNNNGNNSGNNIANMGPNASYQFASQSYMRSNYPPINPSDQNPPCNTLYVGNLPMDASEDELKALFSKQRGYKRLCLRTKANGPMCFVEFEDITCASKALTECYGIPLHNSTKGGIRLSFSKNPLGVRTGQPGSIAGPSNMSPQGPMQNMGGMQAFSTVNGPPPGLNPPPGLLGGGLNGGHIGINTSSGTPTTNGFPNPLMSPIGTQSSQNMRTPTSAIGQGWNWPARENKRDVPASMMGR